MSTVLESERRSNKDLELFPVNENAISAIHPQESVRSESHMMHLAKSFRSCVFSMKLDALCVHHSSSLSVHREGACSTAQTDHAIMTDSKICPVSKVHFDFTMTAVEYILLHVQIDCCFR